MKTPVGNKEPYFPVDPVFRGAPKKVPSRTGKYQGVAYSVRYELLCRRLVLERLYNSACFMIATNEKHTKIASLLKI